MEALNNNNVTINFSSFDKNQMKEIQTGLDTDLDVTLYARPSWSAAYMKVIRQLMTKVTTNISFLKEYPFHRMELILKMIIQGLDISPVLSLEMDDSQASEIYNGMKGGVNFSLYCD